MTAPTSELDTDAVDDDDTASASEGEPTFVARPRRERRWTRRLVRALLALIVIGALGFGAYLLWPEIDERVTAPIASNTDDIAALDARLDALETRLADLESQLADVATTQAGDLVDEAEITNRIDALEAAVDAQVARLEGLEDTAFALAETDQAAAAQTRTDVTVLRAMDLLSRARLSLYEANYGLAREDVVTARAVLEELGSRDASLSEAIDRLDGTIEALPDRPVAAAADLDIAWQALLGDVDLPETTVTSLPSSSDTANTTTSTDS